MVMCRGLRAACVAIAMVFVVACGSGATGAKEMNLNQIAKRFVPSDASDQVVATGIPWAQIDFVVKRQAFEYAFDEHALTNAATSEGWLLCRPKSEEWWAYEDHSVTPSRYLQQRAVTLFKDGVLVMLLGKYVSRSEQEAVTKQNPSAERVPQQGVSSARKASREEAAGVAKSFDLLCGTG